MLALTCAAMVLRRSGKTSRIAALGRFGAKAPRNQPGASLACPLGQGPLPTPGGPVPGPGRGPGDCRDGSGHPFERPRRPGRVQSEPKGHQQRRRGPAVITSHPGSVA